jgi:hypothetical protein
MPQPPSGIKQGLEVTKLTFKSRPLSLSLAAVVFAAEYRRRCGMAGHPANLTRSDMGYFNGLTSGSFKIAPDGRRLFFPWGVLGSGYAIASEQDYQRLRRQVKVYMIVTLVLVIIAPNLYEGYVGTAVIAGLLVTFYLVWMWRLLPRLTNSGERLSLQESMTTQARAHGPTVLWLLEIVAFAFVGCGILMFVVDPNHWLGALAVTMFFGLCAAKITRMLMLQRRSGNDGR